MLKPNDNLTLLRLLHQCAHRINMSSKFPGQGRLLVLLHKKGTLTQRELIEITQRRSATLSEQLASMEKSGYITRTKNSLDNRNIDVSLTALGEQAAIEAEQARAELADRVFGTLQKEEKMQLETILLKLSQTLPPSCHEKRSIVHMKLIFHYIRKHLGSFIAAMIFLCIEATADLLQPTFMGYIVDNGVKDANIGQIMYYGAIMLGIAAVGAFSAVMRNIFFMSYFTIYRQRITW